MSSAVPVIYLTIVLLSCDKREQSEMLHFNLLYFHFTVLTRICYASDRADSGQIAHLQVSEISVLSRPDVKHPSSEVWLLEHQPVAIHHVARLAVRHTETFHHILTVICELMHLASEVLPLIDPHSERSPVL